jgi:hypothetical protein
MSIDRNKNYTDSEDLYPIKSLTFKEILHLTIVCSILTFLISALVLKAVFRADLFDGDMRASMMSLMTGGSISYALGNITIYRYYEGQKKDREARIKKDKSCGQETN